MKLLVSRPLTEDEVFDGHYNMTDEGEFLIPPCPAFFDSHQREFIGASSRQFSTLGVVTEFKMHYVRRLLRHCPFVLEAEMKHSGAYFYVWQRVADLSEKLADAVTGDVFSLQDSPGHVENIVLSHV